MRTRVFSLFLVLIFTAAGLPALAQDNANQEAPRAFHTNPGEKLGFLEELRSQVKTEAAPAVYLLHFIDCDSGRCRDSLKAIQEFVAEPLQYRTLLLAAVAVGDSPGQAAGLQKDLELSFPVLADPERKWFDQIAPGGVSRTMILNEEGAIVYQHAGWSPGREAEFRIVAESLINKQGMIPGLGDGSADSAPSKYGATSSDFSRELYARDVRGKQAPDVPVEKWISQPKDHEGKFLLVDFWATWCGPCRVALEEAEKIHHKFDNKLVTWAISDEDEATVRSYVKQAGLEQPIGIDTQARAKKELEVRGIPHALLINPSGQVVWQGHPMTLWRDGGARMKEILDAENAKE